MFVRRGVNKYYMFVDDIARYILFRSLLPTEIPFQFRTNLSLSISPPSSRDRRAITILQIRRFKR